MTRSDDTTKDDNLEKVERFQAALDQLIERIAEDRYVLAVVLVGSLSTKTVWHRESLGLWIIEADGVSRRLPSDGNDERVFRILVENGINVHAEVIPRSRFKQMVEGASRTAFSCNFFALREIVYSQRSVDRHLVQEGQQHGDEGSGAGTADVLDLDDPCASTCPQATRHQGGSRAGGAGNARRRAQRGAHRNHPPGPGVGRRCDLSGH